MTEGPFQANNLVESDEDMVVFSEMSPQSTDSIALMTRLGFRIELNRDPADVVRSGVPSVLGISESTLDRA